MVRIAMLMVMAVVALMLAQPASAAAASICDARAFTAPTKYMSLQGYVRWQQYRAHGTWVSHKQAVVLTQQQLRACPMKPHGA